MRAALGFLAARLSSGWTAVALIAAALLAVWLPDLGQPLGNSDDGRILGLFGLQARNFWELGVVDSRFGAAVEPYVRAVYDVAPRAEPPPVAVTYAHHPPLQVFMSVVSTGILGDSAAALRVPSLLVGAATVVFMASLLRGRGLAWGPTLLAVAAMASTGFYYVYARVSVSFSLQLAAIAAVSWALHRAEPRRRDTLVVAGFAALAAMQSWIGIAAMGLVMLWLLVTRQRDGSEPPSSGTEPSVGPVVAARPRRLAVPWPSGGRQRLLVAVAAGTALGAGATALWMLSAAGYDDLANQVAIRTSNEVGGTSGPTFTFGEFLARQWRFVSEEMLVPVWLRVLLVPCLLAGLIDRRTRAPTAITLAVAAALTFGVQQGAWVHRLWNFPWLAPVTIGFAALVDWVRRPIPRRWRPLPAALAAVVIAGTLVAVASGSTRQRYITDPADAGTVLEQVGRLSGSQLAWAVPPVTSPTWVSYYLRTRVIDLNEDNLGDLGESDVVVLRADRVPDYFPEGALSDPLAAHNDFLVISASKLLPE
ncbi:MAG: glycosyltransferase family 39 protein [Acidimicrobiaceae bacterium]|nr:glycosyltransferase family 39 protein [Acidimicrobiaceae bacterium]MYH76552.1 glycosyltransferase family 39 protein [Acidimicrobiaceae bacterium]